MAGPRRYFPSLLTILACGVFFQLWLGSRGNVGGDQCVLLDLGLDFVEGKGLQGWAKGMSGGGIIPGSLLQLLIGVPFSIWHDYRAPVVAVGLFHLLAALIAAAAVRQAAGDRAALVFTILWWLSPWRLYHSGFLWEPTYVFLPAAAHLWACWRLRDRAGFVPSAVLAAVLLLTFQLHGSFLVLVLLTAVLLVRRLIRIDWKGGAAGAAAGSLTLVPTFAAAAAGNLPDVTPTKSFIGYGLVTVVPMLRGFSYWFRLGSLDIGRRLTGTVYLEKDWSGGEPLGTALTASTLLVSALAVASVALAAAASWWYFRRAGGGEARSGGWYWMRSYAFAVFLSVLAASALSPVTIQGWHVLIALPAACLPVAMWIDGNWPPGRRWLAWAIGLFLLLRLPEMVIIGTGHEMYRVRQGISVPLQERQKALVPDSCLTGR